ncbi:MULTISPECIES: hypothetical protein [Sphingobium]|uniref:hypothetical protein n=1 Tax=Sphingobium TaxID=165695 RepID=UPI0017E6E7D9|nr:MULTISPECIES: hypothetical protein [Sphingobium]MCW2361861.1 hypothetical protein [Sphingobium sp. B10D3B]MCW2401460.1 hypothetical protein [Sphingobium sp. B10D7B]MCW2408440.1 hypothetical protein [Sphingobium xanthum]
MSFRLNVAASLLAAASPVALFAQAPMAGRDHAGHQSASPVTPSAENAGETMDHSTMDHGAMDHAGMNHSGMDHSGMDHAQHNAEAPASAPNHIHPTDTAQPYVDGSGTARLPAAQGPMSGLHAMSGDWMLMAHGNVQLNYTDHKGPRGDDLVYATSMLMLAAERDLGGARLALRSMLSLEPTMSARGYPNLFATGETAGGAALVDRQHPHDLFMELAARLDVDIAPGASVFLYGGPVGEPALGPSAFMHRASAHYNPEPPITHHWFDSTHITYGVVTAGVALPQWQLEGSAFRGREPDEERWGIETSKLDSWSVRLSWTPTPNWAAQVSHGFLKNPETLHGDQNEHRTTASVHYADGALSATAAFSAKNRDPGDTLTAWLGEINYDLTPRHSLFGRVENVANDELIPDHDDPLHDVPFRITKMQAGYAWNTPIGDGPVHLALGGSVNLYAKPAALDAVYGDNPWGCTLFARLSLGR